MVDNMLNIDALINKLNQCDKTQIVAAYINNPPVVFVFKLSNDGKTAFNSSGVLNSVF